MGLPRSQASLSSLLLLSILCQASLYVQCSASAQDTQESSTRRRLNEDPVTAVKGSLDTLISKGTVKLNAAKFQVNAAPATTKKGAAAPVKTPPAKTPPGKTPPGKTPPGKTPPAKTSPGKKVPPPTKKSSLASPPPPSFPAGRAKLQKLIDAMNKKYWKSAKKEYDTFWDMLTEESYQDVLANQLQKNYAITILWPMNNVCKYKKNIPAKYTRQRLGYHVVDGAIEFAKFNSMKVGSMWRTAVHYPSVAFSGVTPVLYRLNTKTLQLGPRKDSPSGGQIVAPDIYKDASIVVHGIDAVLEPYRYWDTIP